MVRGGDVDGFDERETGGEREGRRGGILLAQIDEGAAVEIPRRRYPAAALPSPSCGLIERDQPVAFDCLFVRDQVGVGRAGALDDADARQKIDPAALSVSVCKGWIRR